MFWLYQMFDLDNPELPLKDQGACDNKLTYSKKSSFKMITT
jgi:hypothetical protein